jgi:DNA (cytosine-5)-methyltransferase 1
MHKFPYKWTLKDTIFTKDKGKVFSCFSCGGGSTMGYKLAGFDVLGCNEIDPKMMACYIANHEPKYSFLEPIQTFKLRNDLPKELYDLDILDGSPPCSQFSMSGDREENWGKEKKFREGQQSQILDTLFFDFIDLTKELQPKVVIAENVKGLLLGEAKKYVSKIYDQFDKAGYYVQHFLLNGSDMGLPQRRERVFFVCLRKDLGLNFLYQKDLFTITPKISLCFNEPEIPFSDFEHDFELDSKKVPEGFFPYFNECKPGCSMSTVSPRGPNYWFNFIKIDPNKSLPTLASAADDKIWHYEKPHPLGNGHWHCGQSYPLDYDFVEDKPKYIMGMSVPPIMMAQIATNIYEQWLSKL